MKIKKQLEVRERMLERLHAAYHMAFLCGWSLDELLAALNKDIWQDKHFLKLPNIVKDYIKGAANECWNQLYRPLYGFVDKRRTPALVAPLEWVLVGTDGIRYREDDNKWLERDSNYKADLTGNHVWRHKLNEGEWKPFSVDTTARTRGKVFRTEN